MTPHDLLRAELRRVLELVPDGSRVLDLGCGDGALMARLRDEKGCVVRGIELDRDAVAAAVARGLSVVQADLDEGLAGYDDGSFDVVILSDTLQVVRYPKVVIAHMLRVGRRCIVSFPNFAHWRVRLFLGSRGRMPVAPSIPYTWYETPNIHHTTIADFREFIASAGGEVDEEFPLVFPRGRSDGRVVRAFANLRAEAAVVVVRPTTTV